jgi:ATP-dependent helicase/nuclease subunit A
MIDATLASDADIERAPAFWNPEESVIRLISAGAIAAGAAAAERGSSVAAAPASAPDWLCRRVEPVAEAPLPIRPSSALAAADRWSDAALTPARRAALRVGSLMHVLLQYLPDLPPDGRLRAAWAFLEARAADLDAKTRAGLIDAALRVIDAPELAALFGPQSKAEVAVAGRVALPRGGSIDVVGRIDRIGVNADEALIADFKTGAPCALGDIPRRYLSQMALYRAALAPLWPEKRLRLLLIWTAEPRVITLDDARLDEALAVIEAASAELAGRVA